MRAEGAVPATVGVIGGMPRVGLDEDELGLMATAGDVIRSSRRGTSP